MAFRRCFICSKPIGNKSKSGYCSNCGSRKREQEKKENNKKHKEARIREIKDVA